MTNSHANCDHAKTKAGRAACRKARAQGGTSKIVKTKIVMPAARTVEDTTAVADYLASQIKPSEPTDVSVRSMQISVRVDAEQVLRTRDKVDKINKRAAKKGLAGLIEMGIRQIDRCEKDEFTGIERKWVEYEVTLSGTAPAYDGWEVIARLDWDPYAGLIVSNVPGYEGVDRDSVREGWCDHCKKTRQRKVTYVVRNQETGEMLQVGRSTCLKDFTGQFTTVAFPELPESDDDESWFGIRQPIEYDPKTVLAYAWAICKLHGFVSVKEYDKTSTKAMVLDALYPGKSREAQQFAREIAPLAYEAAAKSEEIHAFLLSDEFASDSDYVTNLRAIARGQLVSQRNFGILVSAPQAYARHQEKTLVREREDSIYKSSEYVGSEGDRIEIDVTIKSIRAIDGDYGSKALYTMLTDEGDVIEWFSTNWTLGEDADVRFRIRGTVKRHKIWNGMKSTQLTRCTVVA